MPPTLHLSTHRARRIAVIVVLGGGLALGVGGLAQAAAEAPAPSGSAAPSAQPGDPGRGAPREHKPHLHGTVTSISDTRILITDRDGFTRQINIKSKPDGVAVGTQIRAEGAVNKDGVSLDATSVEVAPQGEGKRGGGPGHRGGERPDGPRGGPGAPPGPNSSNPPSGPAAPNNSAPPPGPAAPNNSTPPSAAAPAPSAS